jgi:hypothetical protein
MKKTIVLLDWATEKYWFRRKDFYEKSSTAYFGLNMRPFFENFFNIEIYDETKSYDKTQHIFVICDIYNQEQFLNNLPLYASLRNDGFKVIIWHFTEYYPEHHPEIYNQFEIFNVTNWFWFNEVFRHLNGWESFRGDKKLIFHKFSYPREANRNKLALMPIGRLRNHREELLKKMEPLLPDVLYSCMKENIYLPRNINFENQYNLWEYENLGIINDRYFNPDWYNDTYFSLVSETCVIRQPFLHNKNNFDSPLFITEKTYKPIMYGHPFIIHGQPGIVKHLKSLGFETYDNLFDESYDETDDAYVRLDQIVENVKKLQGNVYSNKKSSKFLYDRITEGKIEHNYHLFFNADVVEYRLVNDLVYPFLEMCE